jgi:ankyrin repeat protein
MERSGIPNLHDFSKEENIAKRVLHFATNLRSQPNTEANRLLDTTVLHGLVRSFVRENITARSYEPYINAANLLLDSGMDINAQDRSLTTPLHLAVDYGILPLVDFLLEAGANPNVVNAEGMSPLTMSVHSGPLDVTRSLLGHGADPAIFTGVTIADIEGELETIHELLEMGLDPYGSVPGLPSTLASLISWSPGARSYALNGNFDFYRVLEREPSFLCTDFGEGLSFSPIGLKAVVKRLPQECRADFVNFEQHVGLSLGCIAILGDKSEYLDLLLDAGLDIEREWQDKGTVLMFAASLGAFRCFKTLVRYGARLLYLGTGRRGEVVVKSVVEEARRYPKLLQWLFVDRHYETKCLTAVEHSGPFAATKPWSGPHKAAYSFAGYGEEYPRLRSESMIDYLCRAARVRRDLRGKTLPVTLVD